MARIDLEPYQHHYSMAELTRLPYRYHIRLPKNRVIDSLGFGIPKNQKTTVFLKRELKQLAFLHLCILGLVVSQFVKLG